MCASLRMRSEQSVKFHLCQRLKPVVVLLYDLLPCAVMPCRCIIRTACERRLSAQSRWNRRAKNREGRKDGSTNFFCPGASPPSIECWPRASLNPNKSRLPAGWLSLAGYDRRFWSMQRRRTPRL